MRRSWKAQPGSCPLDGGVSAFSIGILGLQGQYESYWISKQQSAKCACERQSDRSFPVFREDVWRQLSKNAFLEEDASAS